jgi:Transposase/Transposase IS116/IS110/IS902 family
MRYAGIDWADQHHDAVVIDEAGRRLGATRVAHSAAGLGELRTFLRAQSGPAAELACIVETNNGLLIAALLDADLVVYPVNPSTVDRHRKPAGAKTDALDAYLLARTGRSDLADLRPLTPDSPLIAELKALTRDQDMLIRSQTRLVNQLTACLKAYYPVALGLFCKVHQPTTLSFLEAYPTPQDAGRATPEALAALLHTASHPHAEQKAQQVVQRLGAPQLCASAPIARAKARLMLALVAQLRPLLAAIAAYDGEIARLFVQHADSALFAGLPRAARRLAPRRLAEWGDDRSRYADAAAVQALGGTAPVPRASGTVARAHKREACVKPLRNALCQFAWQSTRKEEWAAAYYRRKRGEGKSHPLAVRALANLWVRIIFAVWRKRERYDPAIFRAAQHAHAPRAA